MSTRIQTFGPKEVQESVITQSGSSLVWRYEYYVEAVGSDGRRYFATGRARPTPYVDEQEYFREMTGKTLERRMKEEGLWDGEGHEVGAS